MKLFNTILVGTAFLIGITSCEMKDEIKGNGDGGDSSVMGLLSLNLSAVETTNDVNTKASGVSTDNFKVNIVRANGTVYKAFNTFAQLKEESPVQIPIGKYTIEASSPGEIPSVSKSPYFAGDKAIQIEENLTASAEVACNIQNVKFGLTLADNFKETFPSYSISLQSGTDLAYTYSSENGDLAPVYLDASKVKSDIIILIKAVKADNTVIQLRKTLSKPDGYGGFEAGDFLNITFDVADVDPDQPSPGTPTQPGTAISVKVDMTFNNREETITIDVVDDTTDPDNPDQPGTNGPTLTCQYFSSPINISPSSTAPSKVDVAIEAPNKIANLKVTITSDNAGFTGALAAMGINWTFDLTNLDAELKAKLDQIGLPSEGIKEATSYTFSIGSFMSMLAVFDGTHTFKIEVVDANGVSAQNTLTVKVTK